MKAGGRHGTVSALAREVNALGDTPFGYLDEPDAHEASETKHGSMISMTLPANYAPANEPLRQKLAEPNRAALRMTTAHLPEFRTICYTHKSNVLTFWNWTSDTQLFEIELSHAREIYGLAVCEPKLDLTLEMIIPELAWLWNRMRELDALAHAMPDLVPQPPPPDHRTEDEAISILNGLSIVGQGSEGTRDAGPEAISAIPMIRICVVLTDLGIEELLIVGSELEGVYGYTRCPETFVEFDCKRVTALAVHGPTQKVIFGDQAGTLWEYQSIQIKELYIGVQGSLFSHNAVYQRAHNRLKILNWGRSSSNYRNKIGRAGVRKLFSCASTLVDRFRGVAATRVFTDVVPSKNSAQVFALTDSGNLYALSLPPPTTQIIDDCIIQYCETTTQYSAEPVLPWEGLIRNMLDWLSIPCNVVTGGDVSIAARIKSCLSSNSLANQLKSELAICGVTISSANSVTILLSDGTRVVCSPPMPQRFQHAAGRGLISENCRPLHDALRPSMDPTVWAILQQSSKLTTEFQASTQSLIVTQILWPPHYLLKYSPLYPLIQGVEAVPEVLPADAPTRVVVSYLNERNTWLLCINEGELIFVHKNKWQRISTEEAVLVLAGGPTEAYRCHHRLVNASNNWPLIYQCRRRLEISAAACCCGPRALNKNVNASVLSSLAICGSPGMSQLSLLMPAEGLIGLTPKGLIGYKRNLLGDEMACHLLALKTIADALFKDLTFAVPFAPHGLQISEPHQLVAALERGASMPLVGLSSWAELAWQTKPPAEESVEPEAASEVTEYQRIFTRPSHYDNDEMRRMTGMGRSIYPIESAWLLAQSQVKKTVDMAWCFMAQHGNDVSRTQIDTCCRLLFSLSALSKLREGFEAEASQSVKRLVIQLLNDLSQRSLFSVKCGFREQSCLKLALAPASMSHYHDDDHHGAGDYMNNSQNSSPNPVRKKRALNETSPSSVSGGSYVSLCSSFSPDDYDKGSQCCAQISEAIRFYDEFLKSQVSPDVRSKVCEDTLHFQDTTKLLDIIGELLGFLKLLSRAMTDLDSIELQVTPSILTEFAQHTCATLLANVIHERETSLLARWFNEGSLTKLVSPNLMLATCPTLFDAQQLKWSSAVEPLHCLADSVDGAHHKRKRAAQTLQMGAQPFVVKESLGLNRPMLSLPSSKQRRGTTSPLSPLALESNAASQLPPTSVDSGAAFEYLYSIWEQEADPEDLNICLPLPSFLKRGVPNAVSFQFYNDLVELSTCAADEYGGLRDYVVKALSTSVVISRDRANGEPFRRDEVMQEMLEILFRIHAYDVMHFTCALWIDLCNRFNLWRGGSTAAGDAAGGLPANVSQSINRYLDRLLAVGDKTDRMLGWNLLVALVRQLTCCAIPRLGTDDPALGSFVGSLQTHAGPIAHCVFTWIVNHSVPANQRNAVEFQKKRASLGLNELMDNCLQSPHMETWLESQPRRMDMLSRGANHASVLAVSDLYISQHNYASALQQLLAGIESQANWIEIPLQATTVIRRLNLKNRKTTPAKPSSPFGGWFGSKIDTEPIEGDNTMIALSPSSSTLSTSRRIIEPAIAKDVKAAFRSKLACGDAITRSDRWPIIVELLNRIRQMGDFPVDVRHHCVIKCLLLSALDERNRAANGLDVKPSAPAERDALPNSQSGHPNRSYLGMSLLSNTALTAPPATQPPALKRESGITKPYLSQQTQLGSRRRSTSPVASQQSNPWGGLSQPVTASRRWRSGALGSVRLRDNEGLLPAASQSRWNDRRPSGLSPRLSARPKPIEPLELLKPQAPPSFLSNLMDSQTLGSQGLLPPNNGATQTLSTGSGVISQAKGILLLEPSDAEKLKEEAARHGGFRLEKMAEALTVPSYLSKTVNGGRSSDSNKDRLKTMHQRILYQKELILDMAEHLFYLMIDDKVKTEFKNVTDSLSGRRNVELLHQDLKDPVLNNTLGLLTKFWHHHFQTYYSMVEPVIRFATSGTTAPISMINVLACWSKLDDTRSRMREQAKLLPANLQDLNVDLSMSLAAVNSTLAERMAVAKNLGSITYVTDALFQFWNVYASALVQNEEKNIRALPYVLWRFACSRLNQLSAQDMAVDPAMLQERKLRLNKFADVWEEHYNINANPDIFTYEGTVRAFIWDLVGITRDPVTADQYDTEVQIQGDPLRLLNVYQPANDWLYQIGNGILAELAIRRGFLFQQRQLATDSAKAVLKFFGNDINVMLEDTVLKNVLKDMLSLASWVAQVGLPGLKQIFPALLNDSGVTDTRYLPPMIRKAISVAQQDAVLRLESWSSVVGRECYELGLFDDRTTVSDDIDKLKWAVEARDPTTGTYQLTVERLRQLCDSMDHGLSLCVKLSEYVNDLNRQLGISESFAEINAAEKLRTILAAYKQCLSSIR